MNPFVRFWLLALSVVVAVGAILVLLVSSFVPTAPWGTLGVTGRVVVIGIGVVAIGLLIGVTAADSSRQ